MFFLEIELRTLVPRLISLDSGYLSLHPSVLLRILYAAFSLATLTSFATFGPGCKG